MKKKSKNAPTAVQNGKTPSTVTDSKKKCSRKWCVIVCVTTFAVLLAVTLWLILRNGDGGDGHIDPSQNTADQQGVTGGDTAERSDNPWKPLDDLIGTSEPTAPSVNDETDQTESSSHLDSTEDTVPSETDSTAQSNENTASTENDPADVTEPSAESPTEEIVDNNHGSYRFVEGITISKISKYAGMYMEDGSNAMVTDIMMMIVTNETSSDLQLARFEIVYSDFAAEFEVTNLPAGQSVVALEKNAKTYVDESYQLAKIKDVVFFSEPMSLCSERIKVTGNDGYIQVENISQETFGVVYVYYKNCAPDGLFYGGITYRAKIEPGLKPGDKTQVLTSHYVADFCSVLLVQIGEYTTQ